MGIHRRRPNRRTAAGNRPRPVIRSLHILGGTWWAIRGVSRTPVVGSERRGSGWIVGETRVMDFQYQSGPRAGVFVDRWNVKRTMIISDLIRAAVILGLVFVTRLEQIYVLFFLVSTVSSFFGPSQSVAVRTLVPVNGLMAANALMSQAFYTMRIIAPAAAGLLVYWLGYNSCFYLDSASFFFAAALLSAIAIVRMVKAKDAAKKTVGSLMKD